MMGSGVMAADKLTFRPSFWPSLVTLLLIPALASLGFWQLDRARQKQDFLAGMDRSLLDEELRLTGPLSSAQGLDYRPVVVDGVYDVAHQYLLDNKVYQGKAGYHVLTPLRIKGSRAVVLVNRGWVPVGESRDILPELPAMTTAVTVHGLVKLPPEKPFVLAGEEATSDWPRVVQQIRLGPMARQLDSELLPLTVLLDPQEASGFSRHWTNPLPFGPERNVGYAFQWFAMAFAVAAIYILVNIRRVSDE